MPQYAEDKCGLNARHFTVISWSVRWVGAFNNFNSAMLKRDRYFEFHVMFAGPMDRWRRKKLVVSPVRVLLEDTKNRRRDSRWSITATRLGHNLVNIYLELVSTVVNKYNSFLNVGAGRPSASVHFPLKSTSNSLPIGEEDKSECWECRRCRFPIGQSGHPIGKCFLMVDGVKCEGKFVTFPSSASELIVAASQ